MSEGSFPDQANHGGEIVEHIGQEDEGSDARQAIDGQAFEAPVFESGVAAFNSIPGAVVELLPGVPTDKNISDQADRSIGETFSDVDDAAMGVVGELVRAVRRRINDFREADFGDTA